MRFILPKPLHYGDGILQWANKNNEIYIGSAHNMVMKTIKMDIQMERKAKDEHE